MAYGDIGAFTPAESTYSRPGMYGDALRAEAAKRANYLSQMDQFYAQLEESQRQFDEMLEFKESQWEEELAFRRDRMSLEDEWHEDAMTMKSRELNLASRSQRAQASSSADQLDFLRDMMKEPFTGTPSRSIAPQGYSSMYDSETGYASEQTPIKQEEGSGYSDYDDIGDIGFQTPKCTHCVDLRGI